MCSTVESVLVPDIDTLEQVDSLPSKNQALLSYNYDIKRKLHEQGLITKKYIAMHTNHFLIFKWLYTLVS